MSEEIRAYIAGFLDGDGCLMAQLVKRAGYVYGYQIRTSIVFYQKTKNEKVLYWLKVRLREGYIRRRNDGMSEYTIVGMKGVKKILVMLLPHLTLKKQLAREIISLISQWPENGRPTKEKYLKLCRRVDATAVYNYSKKRKITTAQVEKYLTKN
jgi:hypothetical protein